MNLQRPRATELQSACLAILHICRFFCDFSVVREISSARPLHSLLGLQDYFALVVISQRSTSGGDRTRKRPGFLARRIFRFCYRGIFKARRASRCVSPKCETADKPRYLRDSSSDIPRSTPEGIRTLTVPDLGRLPLPIGITGA